jgi:hypothetical protein
MKEIVLKLWKDPVWSKVIASGLLLFFGAIGVWILDLWPHIYEFLSKAWALVIYRVPIPLWLISILVPLLVFSIPLARSLMPDREPDFLKYRRDKIFGINWSWDWSKPNLYNDKYSIRNIHPRCPSCNSSLELNDYSGILVHCINDECEWSWNQQGSFENRISHSSQLNQKVINVIDRKVHNGEYKT